VMNISSAHALKVIRAVGRGELGVRHKVSPAEIGPRSPSRNMALMHLRQCKNMTHSETIAAWTKALLRSGVVEVERGWAKCGERV
jgi:hypothetical protein